MFKPLKAIGVALTLALSALTFQAVAQPASESKADTKADTKADIKADTEAVGKLFAERFDNPPVKAIRATPYGLYEVQMGNEIVYTDRNVSFVFDGTLIDAKTRKDVTAERLEQLSRIVFDDLPLDLAFKQVKGNGQRKIAIFEDPNCGYCKQLRQTLQKVDNLTVYTFLLPILSPDSTQKVRDVWCAKDRGAVWDAWMLNGQVPPKTDACDVPIDRMLELAKKLSVRGTPAIFFANGSRVPGAISQQELEQRLKAQ